MANLSSEISDVIFFTLILLVQDLINAHGMNALVHIRPILFNFYQTNGSPSIRSFLGDKRISVIIEQLRHLMAHQGGGGDERDQAWMFIEHSFMGLSHSEQPRHHSYPSVRFESSSHDKQSDKQQQRKDSGVNRGNPVKDRQPFSWMPPGSRQQHKHTYDNTSESRSTSPQPTSNRNRYHHEKPSPHHRRSPSPSPARGRSPSPGPGGRYVWYRHNQPSKQILVRNIPVDDNTRANHVLQTVQQELRDRGFITNLAQLTLQPYRNHQPQNTRDVIITFENIDDARAFMRDKARKLSTLGPPLPQAILMGYNGRTTATDLPNRNPPSDQQQEKPPTSTSEDHKRKHHRQQDQQPGTTPMDVDENNGNDTDSENHLNSSGLQTPPPRTKSGRTDLLPSPRTASGEPFKKKGTAESAGRSETPQQTGTSGGTSAATTTLTLNEEEEDLSATGGDGRIEEEDDQEDDLSLLLTNENNDDL